MFQYTKEILNCNFHIYCPVKLQDREDMMHSSLSGWNFNFKENPTWKGKHWKLSLKSKSKHVFSLLLVYLITNNSNFQHVTWIRILPALAVQNFAWNIFLQKPVNMFLVFQK